ncbi:MAG: ABC transporter permease [Burkholderiaceae bacterium]
MEPFSQSVALALHLIARHDPELVGIILLSVRVSVLATTFASVIGLPLGALVALASFPGRGLLVVTLNALVGLPSVVVGLTAYLLISRAGPLGSLGILFTPAAMIIAQTILVFPLIAALTRQLIHDVWSEYQEQLRSLGVSRLRAARTLLWDCRFSLGTVLMAAFGRAISEVGSVMIVGGNIAGVTRVMTTTIALQTSMGNLPLALALGGLLLFIVVAVNALSHATMSLAQRRYG